MDNPGINTLSLDVTTAGTQTTGAEDVINLQGMTGLTVDIQFIYGSGGTSVKAYLQTALGAGPWIDIACAAFTTASDRKVFNLSGLDKIETPVTPTDGAMTDNTAKSGILGDRIRLKLVTVGTYAGSTQVIARTAGR